MSAVDPRTQSRRVCTTISMIVATPRPSSPTRCATASSSRISAEAFERLPSLSFSRSIRKPFRVPSSRIRGRRKQVRPSGACARTRNASDIGAEQNHLSPREQIDVARGLGARLVGADVRSTLALGHRHPAERTGLVEVRTEVGVVRRRPEQRRPLVREPGRRRGSEGGHGRERHREGAPDAGLGVGERHEPGRASDVAARRPSAARGRRRARGARARRGGTRPRRSARRNGRACEGSAGARSRAARARVARRRRAARTPRTALRRRAAPSRRSASTSGRFSENRS